MNINENLWKDTEAKEFGDFESLELGGHELVIKDGREHTNPITENKSLKISVDIAGNDKQKGFFQKQYDDNKETDKKWSNAGIKYVSLKEENIAYLKGFITAVENSNKGFKFDLKGQWSQLNGLKIAGQFGIEEYQNDKGEIKPTTKLLQFRSLDKLKDIKVPKVKLIDGTMVDYDNYKQENNSSSTKQAKDIFGESAVINSDDLPFEL